MATIAEEELEYESDPEEMKRFLSMRRRKAASDDKEVEREEEDYDNAESKMDWTAVIHSDESYCQGGAAEDYDEDEDEDEEESDFEEVTIYDERLPMLHSV